MVRRISLQAKARGTTVGDRMKMPGACALLRCTVIRRSAAFFIAARASSPNCRCCARAIRRMADTALSHCVSLSFLLSHSRLLLSAAWESVAARHVVAASALLAVAAACLSSSRQPGMRGWEGEPSEKLCARTRFRDARCACVCTVSRVSLSFTATAVLYDFV